MGFERYINNLMDVIRASEREEQKPVEMRVVVGSDKYVIGDFTKRAGVYRLDMKVIELGSESDKLGGKEYNSFEELNEQVVGSGGDYELFHNDEGLFYAEKVSGVNVGGKDGLEEYSFMGEVARVVIPLLQDGEQVHYSKLS